jgi:hypothetical protein
MYGNYSEFLKSAAHAARLPYFALKVKRLSTPLAYHTATVPTSGAMHC